MNVDNTIQGSGQIGDGVLTLENGVSGTIDATGIHNNLILTGLPTTNDGLIEDTGPAGLRIASTTIDNSGTITAPLAGSHVDLASATIVGGVLATANGGVINETDRGSVLDDVAISGATASTLVVENSQYLTLIGTLTNQGTVEVASVGNDTRLLTSGTAVLTGGGVLQFSDNGSNTLSANGGTATLINKDNLIAGAGRDRRRRADRDERRRRRHRRHWRQRPAHRDGWENAGQSWPAGGDLDHRQQWRAADLFFEDRQQRRQQRGKDLATGTNGHVNLQSAYILGGTLVAAQGGLFQAVDRGSTLDNVTVGAGGNFHISNNNYLTVADTLTNLGTVSWDRPATTRGWSSAAPRR